MKNVKKRDACLLLEQTLPDKKTKIEEGNKNYNVLKNENPFYTEKFECWKIQN